MTFDFAIQMVELYKKLITEKEFVLSKQLFRCGTSIGAYVEESVAAQSRKDFIAKLSIASKEARETRYFLKLLSGSKLVDLDYSVYLNSINSIINILTKIIITTQKNMNKTGT